MTDRHAGYIVTLADNIREDDAEEILTALRMVRGVISVQPVVADPTMHFAQELVNASWRQVLGELAAHGPHSKYLPSGPQ